MVSGPRYRSGHRPSCSGHCLAAYFGRRTQVERESESRLEWAQKTAPARTAAPTAPRGIESRPVEELPEGEGEAEAEPLGAAPLDVALPGAAPLEAAPLGAEPLGAAPLEVWLLEVSLLDVSLLDVSLPEVSLLDVSPVLAELSEAEVGEPDWSGVDWLTIQDDADGSVPEGEPSVALASPPGLDVGSPSPETKVTSGPEGLPWPRLPSDGIGKGRMESATTETAVNGVQAYTYQAGMLQGQAT